MSGRVQGSFVSLPFSHTNKRGDTPGVKRTVSNFVVTLNTNTVFPEGTELSAGLVRPLDRMAEFLFGNEDNLKLLVKFGHREAHRFVEDPSVLWSQELVEFFRATARVEVGHMKRGRRLHVHIALKIGHFSSIQLRPELIKEMANRYLTGLGADARLQIRYVNVRGRGPDAEDYVGMGDDALNGAMDRLSINRV